ncbi:MAG: nucleoside hydrolase, partial [Planctomycetia bacterium]
IDDVLALGLIHALQSRGECRLLAVTITKDSPLAPPFTDAVNTFYDRGGIPIGMVQGGVTREPGKYLPLVEVRDGGSLRYPHDAGPDAVDAVRLLRQTLAGRTDGSVVLVQVGFFTNLARLLDTKPDDVSPLAGPDLVRAKVRLLSVMAGAFTPIGGKPHAEYNVVTDLPAARKLAAEWPGPIVWSGFEIGLAMPYPQTSIDRDYTYAPHHPLPEAYALYVPPPHDRPTWDLTSVLAVVRPDRGYFGLSEPGTVTVDEQGRTSFTANAGGRDRYLTATREQAVRCVELFTNLCSEPPHR